MQNKNDFIDLTAGDDEESKLLKTRWVGWWIYVLHCFDWLWVKLRIL